MGAAEMYPAGGAIFMIVALCLAHKREIEVGEDSPIIARALYENPQTECNQNAATSDISM